MSDDDDKAREMRLPEKAKRHGFTLEKSPQTDPQASGFGLYALIVSDSPIPFAGDCEYNMTFDEVEAWFTPRHSNNGLESNTGAIDRLQVEIAAFETQRPGSDPRTHEGRERDIYKRLRELERRQKDDR